MYIAHLYSFSCFKSCFNSVTIPLMQYPWKNTLCPPRDYCMCTNYESLHEMSNLATWLERPSVYSLYILNTSKCRRREFIWSPRDCSVYFCCVVEALVLQRPQNSTSPDECNLWSLKNTRVRVFSKFHEKSCYYLLIIYIKTFWAMHLTYVFAVCHPLLATFAVWKRFCSFINTWS